MFSSSSSSHVVYDFVFAKQNSFYVLFAHNKTKTVTHPLPQVLSSGKVERFIAAVTTTVAMGEGYDPVAHAVEEYRYAASAGPASESESEFVPATESVSESSSASPSAASAASAISTPAGNASTLLASHASAWADIWAGGAVDVLGVGEDGTGRALDIQSHLRSVGWGGGLLFLGCMTAWLHICIAAWLHDCMTAWLHGCISAWLHG
jgi:hypothetical protein